MVTRKYSTKRSYNTIGKLRKRMQLQTAALLILIQFSWVATGFYQLSKEMSFSVPVVEARELPQLDIPDFAWESAKKAGLDPVEFIVVIFNESRFKSDAIGINRNKTYDAGLLQINSIHKDISLEDKLNPYKAIDWAIKKRLKDGSYKAWYGARKSNIN